MRGEAPAGAAIAEPGRPTDRVATTTKLRIDTNVFRSTTPAHLPIRPMPKQMLAACMETGRATRRSPQTGYTLATSRNRPRPMRRYQQAPALVDRHALYSWIDQKTALVTGSAGHALLATWRQSPTALPSWLVDNATSAAGSSFDCRGTDRTPPSDRAETAQRRPIRRSSGAGGVVQS